MTPAMTTRELLLTAGDFKWSVNLGCAAALAIYFWKVDAVLWRRVVFAAAILVLWLALESPIDLLGDEYLFSVHMAAHLMMIVVVAPLFVLAIPEQTARAWLRIPFIARPRRAGWAGPPWPGFPPSSR